MNRQFTVERQPVTEEQENAALTRMRSGVPFRCSDITDVIEGHKARLRVADRLIQRERKAGNIKFDGRAWTWIGAAQ